MLYGSNVWDPLLIIAQIISVQCLFYLSMGLWLAVFLAPYVGRLSIAYVYDWRLMSFKHFTGWLLLAANLANAPMAAMYLLWLVERAKKCLDFGSTCYLIHFIITCAVHGFPTSLAWWVANLAGMIVASILGEWLCVRREMQEIPLNSLRNSRSGAAASAGTSSPAPPSSNGAAPAHTAITVASRQGDGSAGPSSPRGLLPASKAGVANRQSGSGRLVTSVGSSRVHISPGPSRMINIQMSASAVSGALDRDGNSSQSRLARADSKTRLLADDAA